jgi:hypothetical protein
MELAELVAQLSTPDPWRTKKAFTADLADANDAILRCQGDEAKQEVLREWLGKKQPCLFGRLAARSNALFFCVLTMADVEGGDAAVKSKIQRARRLWSKEAFRGRSSGFILALLAEPVVLAVPDAALLALAQRLAFLYLREEITLDRAHLEDICLEVDGDERETWLWRGGVNFFASAGDRRWWHDHRIPGGLAFSTNSVGHLAKSGRLSADRDALHEIMGISSEGGSGGRIDSLPKALEFAMRTIDMATPTTSGKATELRPKVENSQVACPIALPPNLASKDHCEYLGWYDTDATIPTDYFTPAVERPSSVARKTLDFTYLFDRSIDDGDFDLMGEGRRVRSDAHAARSRSSAVRFNRGEPVKVPIAKVPLLHEALSTVD